MKNWLLIIFPYYIYVCSAMRSAFADILVPPVPGISVAAPIHRSTPWAFIRKNFPFVPTIEMSTLFSFPSKKQINTQGAVTENPGTSGFYVRAHHDHEKYISFFILTRKVLIRLLC